MIKDPADILKLTNEQIVEALMASREAQEEAKAEEVMLKEILIEKMTKKKLDGLTAGHWMVTKFKSVRFQTSLEDARKYGATKTEEKVDTTLLGKIYKSGTKVPGATESIQLRITEIKQEA
jgi:hypothetical protein